MSDFSDLKAAFKATVKGVTGVAKEIAGSAGDKAKAVGRIAKLSVDLNKEKENVKGVYAEIGKLYYELNRGDPGEFFIRLFDEVKLASDSIEAMEAELAALKSEVGEGFTEAETEPAGDFEQVVAQSEDEGEYAIDIEVEILDDSILDEEKPE